MPIPYTNETENDFIQRCMTDSEAIDSFPDENQRIAFCFSAWDTKDLNLNFDFVKGLNDVKNKQVINHEIIKK